MNNSAVHPRSFKSTPLYQMAFQEESSNPLVILASYCTPAAVTINCMLCCRSLYPLSKTKKKSSFPIPSRSVSSFLISEGKGSNISAPKYIPRSSYTIFTEVERLSGIGFPLFGCLSTKSVAIAASFHASSSSLPSILGEFVIFPI